MVNRMDRVPFDLDFSLLSVLSKSLDQRCQREGDEWGLEGKF